MDLSAFPMSISTCNNRRFEHLYFQTSNIHFNEKRLYRLQLVVNQVNQGNG